MYKFWVLFHKTTLINDDNNLTDITRLERDNTVNLEYKIPVFTDCKNYMKTIFTFPTDSSFFAKTFLKLSFRNDLKDVHRVRRVLRVLDYYFAESITPLRLLAVYYYTI
jgi:hypothetical protein